MAYLWRPWKAAMDQLPAARADAVLPGPVGTTTSTQAAPELHLTRRELGILYLMGTGHSTPEIAMMLELRPRTVENHKRHIYEKLGVSSQSHAVALAICLGLLDLPRRPAGPGAADSPVGLVRGRAGQCRDDVLGSLVSHGLSFVVVDRHGRPDDERWHRWHRRPVTAVAPVTAAPVTVVLVDPEPADWSLPATLDAPTVVVRSGVRDRSAVIDALSRGASGLVFADDVATALGPVLRIVARGLFAMSGVYAAALADWAQARAAAAPQLTGRERDILRCIASGHTIRQTARVLGIAAKTVEATQARLFRKLGARNRTETLTIADRWGLVDWAAAGAGGRPILPR